jgi:hypothetical protein
MHYQFANIQQFISAAFVKSKKLANSQAGDHFGNICETICNCTGILIIQLSENAGYFQRENIGDVGRSIKLFN